MQMEKETMTKTSENNIEKWNQSRQAVIDKCPYYKDIRPQIKKIKSFENYLQKMNS